MTRRLAFLVMLVVLWSRPALACGCAPFTKMQLVENAVVIFTGVATATSRPFSFGPVCGASSVDPAVIAFTVEGVYKGEAPAAVTVRTRSNEAGCGFGSGTGRRDTVFATTGSSGLETDLCRGNVEGVIARPDYGLPPAHAPRT